MTAPLKTSKRAPAKRKVFARLKNQDVGQELYCFEMIKATRDRDGNTLTEAGVRWWKRRAHKKFLCTLDMIVGRKGRVCLVDGIEYQFMITKHGLEVQRAGFKKPKLIAFDVLVRLSIDQPEMFKDDEIKSKKKTT